MKCRARLPPSDHTVEMQLEWYGPNGANITSDSVTVGETYIVDNFIERDVLFACLTSSHNGVYTCQLTAYFESSNETLVETSDYLLKVLS